MIRGSVLHCVTDLNPKYVCNNVRLERGTEETVTVMMTNV